MCSGLAGEEKQKTAPFVLGGEIMYGPQPLLARKLKVEANIRCDFDHRIIEKGRYATQVVGDPDVVKAQGIFHGRQCYEAALSDYEQKLKEVKMQEEAEHGAR